MSQNEQRWGVFGRQLSLRIFLHFGLLSFIWCPVIFWNEISLSEQDLSLKNFAETLAPQMSGLRLAVFPGAFVILMLSLLWAMLGVGVPVWYSLLSAGMATVIAASYSRFPRHDQASQWLSWAGDHTPRGLQLVFILGLAVSSVFILTRQITRRYESLTSDERIALTPEGEDFAYRALVQSVFKFLGVLITAAALWMVADIRPIPAVAAADSRELRPSVILLATDHSQQIEVMRKTLGQAQFSSWTIFGSPDVKAKFDEILQCRYPIRLMDQSPLVARSGVRITHDYLLPSALDAAGFSVNLLHVVSPGESSVALQMLSRAYAHVRLFRSFGLLLRSRVFHTPDVQLAQIREALSTAVGRGEPAFISASMLSRTRRAANQDDALQFSRFLSALTQQNWISNLIFVVVEFPQGDVDRKDADLSLQSTMGRVSIWMPSRMLDFYESLSSVRLIRGIDLGASLAARLRLSGIVAQCDGASLFDLIERPSIFPRDLVYQEHEVDAQNPVFRKRGWLSSDGYRLEVRESFDGATFQLFKFSTQSVLKKELDQPVEESAITEDTIAIELNRQLDDFLRSAGVEVLQLGPGRVAYSEPFRKIRLSEE